MVLLTSVHVRRAAYNSEHLHIGILFLHTEFVQLVQNSGITLHDFDINATRISTRLGHQRDSDTSGTKE